MALKEIEIDGQSVLVEVTELEVEGGGGAGRWKQTSKDDQEMGQRISGLVGVLTAPVRRSLETAGAAEWTMEITLGFKGETGVPFVAKGEANAAVKVIAKWSKPAPRERGWLMRAKRR